MESIDEKGEYILAKDSVFIHGRDLIKEGKYDDAIEFFAGILQQRAKEYGNDMVFECATAWYEYANALLIKEEDAPSENLLTNTEKPAEPAGDENDEDGEEDETPPDIEVPEEAEQGENPSTQDGGAQEEDVNDLQVAWECFEVCRQLYESKIESVAVEANLSIKEQQDLEISLSNVYIRLGDLQIINNKFAQALDDYNKALTLRRRICAPYDRMLSDVFYSMALAYVYSCSNSNQSDDPSNPSQPPSLDKAQVIEYKKRAMQHYDQAKSVLAAWIEHKIRLQSEPNEAITEEIRKQRELMEELDENIVALKDEIDAEASMAQETTSIATTTIGFGFSSSSSSSSSSAAMSTNDYFLNLASSSSSSAAAAVAELPVVNTLQPKRKEKSITSAPPSAIPVNENHPDNDAIPTKKARLDN